MSNYADDNFIIRRNRCIKDLIVDIQTSLVAIIAWLQQSGRKVNESKTEVCLLHCNETRMKMINVNYNLFTSIPQINVAGVTMDSKMQWNNQTQLKKQIKPSCNSINLKNNLICLNKTHFLKQTSIQYYTKFPKFGIFQH